MNEKLKLCIIDDVQTVSEGISRAISWEQHNIIVAGTALDGHEGLELIHTQKPEIILTDIRMPRINGLEMTEVVLQHYPESKVILLSNYTDFEYAKQALKLGAFDYLAKPFFPDEILQVVLKAKDEIVKTRSKMRIYQEMQYRVRESLPLYRQEFFNLLLHHQTDREELKEKWDALYIDMEMKNFIVLAIRLDQIEEKPALASMQEVELNYFALLNIIEETILQFTKGIVFRESHNRFICICNESELGMSWIAEQCRENIENHTKFTISIGVSLPALHIEQLPDAYRQAMDALSYHFYSGGNAVFSYKEIKNHQQPAAQTEMQLATSEQELYFALRSGDSPKTIDMLKQTLQEISDSNKLLDPQYAAHVYFQLAYGAVRLLLEWNLFDEVKPLEQKLEEWRKREPISRGDLDNMVESIFRESCHIIQQQRVSEAELIIKKSMDYIQEHYADDLSINQLAAQVHVSRSYYTSLFKKISGMTVNQYITNVRIEKAKALLLDYTQVQDVAIKVGYIDRRYFSEVFKKHTGYTPSEFRQNYKG